MKRFSVGMPLLVLAAICLSHATAVAEPPVERKVSEPANANSQERVGAVSGDSEKRQGQDSAAANPADVQTKTNRIVGYRGEIERLQTGEEYQPKTVEPLAASSPPKDVDLIEMATKAMHYLIHNPMKDRNYECRFEIDLLKLPPSMGPNTPDPYITYGDTESRMDWEFLYMRDMNGSQEGREVEDAIRRRIMGYIRDDGLCWLSPWCLCDPRDTHLEPHAMNWTTDKTIVTLVELYRRKHDPRDLAKARKLIGGLQSLASWDAGRAYYPGGMGAWRDGKWAFTGCSDLYPCILDSIGHYLDVKDDPEVRRFAEAFADGMIAGVQKNLGANRILEDGSFGGYNSHLHMRAVLGVARLGLVTHNTRYVDWSRKVYGWLVTQGTDWGWFPEGPDPTKKESKNSETCATGDMADIAACFAKAGHPQYWDDLERFVRNYCREAQFFVTPEYEALYRKVHHGNPKVEEGLRQARDFQGGFVARLTPNSLTIGPTMNMMGCCPPGAMRATYIAWRNVVSESKEGVFVNLCLNRDAPQARVVSFAPKQGRMTVVAKKDASFFLRPPTWAPREHVQAYRDGTKVEPQWHGDYIEFKDSKKGSELTITYPLPHFRQTINVGGGQYTYEWLGNTVLSVNPSGEGLPLFTKAPRELPEIKP